MVDALKRPLEFSRLARELDPRKDVGSSPARVERCDAVAANGYDGFVLSKTGAAAPGR